MTLTQKIMSAHCDGKKLSAGELIMANVDLVLGNDITTPVAVRAYKDKLKGDVFDRDKIAIVLDHFVPNKDIQSAMQCKCCRDFASEHNITNFFDVGEMGIEHALLPEKGLVKPGDAVVGADSHTCTYGAIGAFSTGVGSTDMAYAMKTGKLWFKVPSAIKIVLKGKKSANVCGKDVILHLIGITGVDGALYKSLEFSGNIDQLNIDDRFSICNMAIEAGAKNGIFPVDDVTRAYVKDRVKLPYNEYSADGDGYDSEIEIDLSALRPTVACPHLPSNVKTIDALAKENIKIDQVVIGSCTNGRISDLEAAYNVLKGNKVKKGVRVIVIPATNAIYLEAIKRGYIEEFIKAGAVVSTPTCGPCLGGYMGILAADEVCVATTNRNFIGRMGHESSKIYLASPYIAAQCALTGYIREI